MRDTTSKSQALRDSRLFDQHKPFGADRLYYTYLVSGL
jgi:hypothetical protein